MGVGRRGGRERGLAGAGVGDVLAELQITEDYGAAGERSPEPVAVRQMCRGEAKPFPERLGTLGRAGLWRLGAQPLSCSG